MEKPFGNILYLFPVMMYYGFEAMIVGLFILLLWKLSLIQYLGDVGYFQIISIYWIVKMLLFDVFKLLIGLSSVGDNIEIEK